MIIVNKLRTKNRNLISIQFEFIIIKPINLVKISDILISKDIYKPVSVSKVKNQYFEHYE